MLTIADYVVIIGYFIFMIAVGAYASKKVTSAESYATADASLTMKVMIGTTVATCMGANAAFGNVGAAFTQGISSLISVQLAWNIGWIALIAMSRSLRRSGASSLPDFLQRRYGNTTRMIAAVISLVFLVNSTAAQVSAVGNIFSTFNLMAATPAIIVGGIIIILYTVFGGLYAVAITDTIQAVLLIGGVVIAVPIVAFTQAGGVGNVIANSDPQMLDFFNGFDPVVTIGWILSYCLAAGSHAAYSQRIFASKDEKTAFWGSIWSNLISLIAGSVLMVAVLTAPFIFPEMTNGETFIPLMIYTFFPPVIKGLIIAALFGLVLSTADSFLLMVGTTIVNDIWGAIHPDTSAERRLLLSRVWTVIGGVVCTIMALVGGSVLVLFKTGSAAYGAGMFIPLLLGCFWKKASAKGINVGMLLGCFGTIAWNLLLKASIGIDGVIVGAALCLVASVGLSLMDGGKTAPAQAEA